MKFETITNNEILKTATRISYAGIDFSDKLNDIDKAVLDEAIVLCAHKVAEIGKEDFVGIAKYIYKVKYKGTIENLSVKTIEASIDKIRKLKYATKVKNNMCIIIKQLIIEKIIIKEAFDCFEIGEDTIKISGKICGTIIYTDKSVFLPYSFSALKPKMTHNFLLLLFISLFSNR